MKNVSQASEHSVNARGFFFRFLHRMILASTAALTDEDTMEENSMKDSGRKLGGKFNAWDRMVVIRSFSQIDACHTNCFTFPSGTFKSYRFKFSNLENETDDKGNEWSAYLYCVGVVEHLVSGRLSFGVNGQNVFV